MQFKVDTTATKQSFTDIKLELKRRLEAMVVGFSSEVAEAVMQETPKSTIASIERYKNLYTLRQNKYGILPTPGGFHAGAWQVNLTGNFQMDTAVHSISSVKSSAKTSASSYVLGQTVYIGAVGPGYFYLNKGSSPQAPLGIVAPTISSVQKTYAINITNYFNRGTI